ncbi:hypothetical protein [Actibacterium mucosum]|nr:hypothetical protein [Actibacterium mucosum]
MDHFADGALMVDGDKDHLVVLFSSRVASRRKNFDFLDATKDMRQQRLFLRTGPTDLFFHDGVPGLSQDMNETADFLRFVVGRISPSRVTFTGHSSGGYAAIVLGHMLGVDDIHVVSPVTYLNAKLGADPDGGELWEGVYDDISHHFEETGKDPAFLSCHDIIRRHPNRVQLLRQFVVATSPVDLNHAEHVAGFPHVQTGVYQRGRHVTLAAITLRDGTLLHGLNGDLDTLKKETFQPFVRSNYPAFGDYDPEALRV